MDQALSRSQPLYQQTKSRLAALILHILHILTIEGLALRLPRRGVVVSSITVEDIDQAYHTLCALEAEAARAAAGCITPAQVAELHVVLASPEHGTTLDRRLAANRSLHDRIDAIAPNRWRDEFTFRLRNFIYRMRHVHQHGAQRLAAIRSEHAALVEALAAGDAEGAARCAAAHCLAARADLLAMMEAQ
jgi:DNA-binding GntR family transcriptional regulator